MKKKACTKHEKRGYNPYCLACTKLNMTEADKRRTKKLKRLLFG